MSDFKPLIHSQTNSLPLLAGAAGLLLGLFLSLGALGHLRAVWPMIADESEVKRTFLLLLPGIILAITSVANIALCFHILKDKVWAKYAAFIFNLLAMFYLAYLMQRGVPDHPIGTFLALISSHVILLGATLTTLQWPSGKA